MSVHRGSGHRVGLLPCSAAVILAASVGAGPDIPQPEGERRPAAEAVTLPAAISSAPAPLAETPAAHDGPEIGLASGQVLCPIDLAGALRLAGARSPQIALARKQILLAVADLEKARALWLPSLFIGPTFYRVDGQVQNIAGQVVGVSRGSLCSSARRPRRPTGSRRPRPARGSRP